MASQKRHPEIPNFAGEMMEFMAGKPSNEEIYKYLEKTDLAAMNWLSEHKITDDFRLEAELFTEHLISDCEDIDNLFEEIYDRWPVFGPMLLHIGGEYQVDIDNATIKECIDEMVRVILDFKGSIVVIPFWDKSSLA